MKNLVICQTCHHGNFYGDDCKFCAGLVPNDAEPVVAEYQHYKAPVPNKPKWLDPAHEHRQRYYQLDKHPHAWLERSEGRHLLILQSRLRDEFELTANQAKFVLECWKADTDTGKFPTDNAKLIVALAGALTHMYEHYGNYRPIASV